MRLRTMEYLVSLCLLDGLVRVSHATIQETLGVPVVSYSPTYDFPAFYSRRSGFMVCTQ